MVLSPEMRETLVNGKKVPPAKIRRQLKDIAKPKIVALGATYKPDTCDLRESPALQIVDLLRQDGYVCISL